MNYFYKKLFTLIVLPALFLNSPALASDVNFAKIDLEEATKTASEKGKLIFVNFTARWCLPCKIIDESLYSDPEISELINSNFISVTTDIDSEDGIEWNDIYNANFLPTILLAKSSGGEIERTAGVPKRKEFISLLQRVISENPIDIPVVSQKSKPMTKVSNPAFTNPSVVSTQYDIQLGAFGNESNAIQFFDDMKTKLPNENFRIIKKGSRNLHCVLLRGFNELSLSEAKLKELEKDGINGFVIEL